MPYSFTIRTSILIKMCVMLLLQVGSVLKVELRRETYVDGNWVASLEVQKTKRQLSKDCELLLNQLLRVFTFPGSQLWSGVDGINVGYSGVVVWRSLGGSWRYDGGLGLVGCGGLFFSITGAVILINLKIKRRRRKNNKGRRKNPDPVGCLFKPHVHCHFPRPRSVCCYPRRQPRQLLLPQLLWQLFSASSYPGAPDLEWRAPVDSVPAETRERKSIEVGKVSQIKCLSPTKFTEDEREKYGTRHCQTRLVTIQLWRWCPMHEKRNKVARRKAKSGAFPWSSKSASLRKQLGSHRSSFFFSPTLRLTCKHFLIDMQQRWSSKLDCCLQLFVLLEERERFLQ